MKEKIQKTLAVFILAAFFLCTIVNYILQMYAAQRNMVESSQTLFRQVEQVVQQNNAELYAITQDIRTTCILRAQATAYILQHHPEKIEDYEELQKIAELMDIDEIHIFDKEGVIYSGTVPTYYGLSMYDGEQIGYFRPMLEDTNLSLCQDMTPNTASQENMQYAAIWTEDKSSIVQIGLKPVRVMDFTKKNELSYIFSLLTDGSGSTLLAVDPETHEILGSTLTHIVGLSTDNIGIPAADMHHWGKGFFVTLGDIPTYAVFEKTDTVILGRICSLENLYKDINNSNLRLSFYLVLIFAAQWVIISKYLEQSFVKAIATINAKLQRISDGNLSERLAVHTTPEFTELSTHINRMVAKLEGELWQDELTELYSRRGFYIELENLFRHKEDLKNVALIMIDSDDLKKTNDKYGHENGDKYLCTIAHTLNLLKAPGKIVARLSGDEYAILIPNAPNREILNDYYKQLLELRDSQFLQISVEERIPIRFSIGMSVYDEDGDNYRQLLKVADTRMYEDKMKRKNAPAV